MWQYFQSTTQIQAYVPLFKNLTPPSHTWFHEEHIDFTKKWLGLIHESLLSIILTSNTSNPADSTFKLYLEFNNSPSTLPEPLNCYLCFFFSKQTNFSLFLFQVHCFPYILSVRINSQNVSGNKSSRSSENKILLVFPRD